MPIRPDPDPTLPEMYSIITLHNYEYYYYKVRLRDSLFSTLTFSQARSGQIAWLDAQIKMSEDTPDIQAQPTGEGQ
jgi:hypothetical protein